MIGVPTHPVRTLMMSLAVAVLWQPWEVHSLQASTQDRPSIAGSEVWKTDFSKHTVPFEEFASGGPPKDGIRSVDNPSFITIREAEGWLADRDPVAVVNLDGETRAYPLSILIWHEIVNDEIGGRPVSVTYCPLCNTTIAFDREFRGRILDFGTTGRLRHSDLVMYDRQTETWWQQATGEGLVGEYAGEQLAFVPVTVMSWRDLKEQRPSARVLSRDTGFSRAFTERYGTNPYEGYDRGSGPWRRFFRFGREDRRLPAMERIVALEHNGEHLALPFSLLAEERVASVRVGDLDVVVFWAPGTASAVDNSTIALGRDVGSSSTFSPELGGRSLTFDPAGDGLFQDRETRSTWNLSGRATTGPAAGAQLTEIVHGNHFWFAWAVFRPETEIWRGR
jgi:hypothetical protein